MRTLSFLAATVILASPAPIFGEDATSGTRSTFEFAGWSGQPITVHLFIPEQLAESAPIVFVMHGASRDATRYFGDWVPFAEEYNYVVVVPEFPVSDFPRSARYNNGHVFTDRTYSLRPEGTWTFSVIEPLFDDVVAKIGGLQSHYTIYGHSAGSQFVHRFLYYKPAARANRFIAANAGWYTLPDVDIDYPYGLKGAAIEPTLLPSILAKDLILLLGQEDTDPEAAKLRQTTEARQQGPNRLVRGQTMFRVAEALARDLGLEFNWRLILVPGADHDNAKMTPTAARLVNKESVASIGER